MPHELQSSDQVTYYLADVVTGTVLGTLPLEGEISKSRGQVDTMSWDLALHDPRVSSPTYIESQGPQLTPVMVNRAGNPSMQNTDPSAIQAGADWPLIYDNAVRWTGTRSARTDRQRQLEATNLSRNPSLESDTSGSAGTTNGTLFTFAYDTAFKRTGTRSARTTRTTTSPSNVIGHPYLTPNGSTHAHKVTVTPGQAYSIGMDVRLSVAGRARVSYTWRDSAGGILAGTAQMNGPLTDMAANTWQRHVFENQVAPTNASHVYVQTIGYMPSGGVTAGGEQLWADAVMVNTGPTAQPYFDGDTADDSTYTYAWTGAANESTSTRHGPPTNGILTQLRLTPFFSPAGAAAVTPGEKVSVALMVQCSERAHAQLRLQWLQSSLSPISGTGAVEWGELVEVAGNTWTRLVFEDRTVPATAAYLEVYLDVNKHPYPSGVAVGGEAVWADALMVNAGSTAHDYFDGDTAGSSWNDTPHASPSTRAATYGVARTYRRDDSWANLLQPWKVMVVAEWRGRLIMGWVLTSVTYGGTDVIPLGAATLERLLGAVLVRPHTDPDGGWYNQDLALAAAQTVEQVLVPRGGWAVEWEPSGTNDDVEHVWGDDKTVLAVLDEIQERHGGPAWMTDVDWAPGEEGRRVVKTVRIAHHLGQHRDYVVFRARPGEYTRVLDWSEGMAALEVWASTSGSGLGYTETSYRSSKLDAGWHPYELWLTLGDLDTPALEKRRDHSGMKLEHGTSVWEATLRISEQPLVKHQWQIGDVVTLRVEPSETDPTGGEYVTEVDGWTLNPTDETIRPVLVSEIEEEGES